MGQNRSGFSMGTIALLLVAAWLVSCGGCPQTVWAFQARAAGLDAGRPGATPGATRVLASEQHPQGKDYWQLEAPGLRPLSVAVEPGVMVGGLNQRVEATRHPNLQFDPRTVDNFRICVGGALPSRIPYLHTVLAAVSRNTEEATARVAIDRGDALVLRLLDIEILDAEVN